MKRFHFDHVEQYLFQTNAKITPTHTFGSLQIEWISIYNTLIVPIIVINSCITEYKDYKQIMFYRLDADIQKSLQLFYKDVMNFYKKYSKLISAYLTLLYLNQQSELYEKEYIRCIPSKQSAKLLDIFSKYCMQKETHINDLLISTEECWKFTDKTEWLERYLPIYKTHYVDRCLFFIDRNAQINDIHREILDKCTEDECKYISEMDDDCVLYIENLVDSEHKKQQTLCTDTKEEEKIMHTKEEDMKNNNTEEELDEETRLCIEQLLLEDDIPEVKEQVVMRLNDIDIDIDENEHIDLHSLTVVRLREMCKDLNIRPIPRLKGDCIAELMKHM